MTSKRTPPISLETRWASLDDGRLHAPIPGSADVLPQMYTTRHEDCVRLLVPTPTS